MDSGKPDNAHIFFFYSSNLKALVRSQIINNVGAG